MRIAAKIKFGRESHAHHTH